jgi:hypothetical protein
MSGENATMTEVAPDAAGAGSRAAADRYDLLGVGFTLRTDSVRVRDFFRAAYARFRTQDPPRGDDLVVEALLRARDGLAVLDDGSGRLEMPGSAMHENRAFLFILNALMSRLGDYFVVHGAAIEVDGAGVILAGPPTAGKSTLVTELARRGATFLSDDVAPIHRATGRLHPFPRAIGIRKGGEREAGFDPAGAPAGSVMELPFKWLVDPAALGLRVASRDGADCPISDVIIIDPFGHEGAAHTVNGFRHLDVALADDDGELVAELQGLRGVKSVEIHRRDPYPVYHMTVRRGEPIMRTLSDLCRRRRDVVLYVDEAREAPARRPSEPVLSRMPASAALMELTRDLLNRSDSGALVAATGGLPALLTQLAHTIAGARTWRLLPGAIARTADVVLAAVAARAGS